MKKEDLNVGERLKDGSSWNMGLATVTEITDRGFRYKLDERHSFGARHGWSDSGHAYLVGKDDLETEWLQKVCQWEKVNISYDI